MESSTDDLGNNVAPHPCAEKNNEHISLNQLSLNSNSFSNR